SAALSTIADANAWRSPSKPCSAGLAHFPRRWGGAAGDAETATGTEPSPDLLRLVVAHGHHELVVSVRERAGKYLALRRVRVAALPAARGAAEHVAPGTEVCLGGASRGCGKLHTGPVVHQRQHGGGFA